MNVLSLFDGMSCGQIALDKLGIQVDNYYASEIDKWAIEIAKKNYPNTKHIGDVTKVTADDLPPIDLLMGGSPCQGFSFAGGQLAFDDPRSALFFEYVRLLKELKPKYFLLENVRMKKEFQDVITEQLGVAPIMINSSLLSGQNRNRLYWTNLPITQPEDKGIVLGDILERSPEDKFYLSDKAVDYMGRLRNGKPRFDYHKNPLDGKASCIVAVQYKGVPYGVVDLRPCEPREYNKDSTCHHICDATDIKGNQSIKRVYAETGKAPTLTTMGGGHREPKVLVSEKRYRKLTPLECERLQTVPDNYTEGVSNTQRYKMLGNGWTVDVVAHILEGIDTLGDYRGWDYGYDYVDNDGLGGDLTGQQLKHAKGVQQCLKF